MTEKKGRRCPMTEPGDAEMETTFALFLREIRALAELAGGTVTVGDYAPNDGRRPYRYAMLVLEGDAATERLAEAAALCRESQASMTYYGNTSVPHLNVARARDLTSDEAATMPSGYREVA